MRTIRIAYYKYLDSNKKVILGGAENYLRNLSIIFRNIGYKIIIYQYSDEYFQEVVDDVIVIGVRKANKPSHLIKYIDCHEHDYQNDILIFGTDFMIAENKFVKSIAIQHGVAWDITLEDKVSHFRNYTWIIKGMLRSFIKYHRYKNCNNLICVDYNFINWYRTQVAHIDTRLHVIPNFSKIPEVQHKQTGLSIIFARRLVEYRGTRIFTNAIKIVKKMHPDVNVTIAGEGPEKEWMQQQLQNLEGVTFTSYEPDESLSIHQRHDIAVVPTRGSEGTSLSLLEAMAAGCAVIATNVGGMTNIIIDEFNGLMISPDSDELAAALLKLIENEGLRNKLSFQARKTVTESFSYEKWRERWIKVIQGLDN